MSGGSLDYVYNKVHDAVEQIRSRSCRPLHVAFADHLNLVAIALQDLEWEFSCDTSPGDADAAIAMCIEPADVLRTLVASGNETIEELKVWVEKAKQ